MAGSLFNGSVATNRLLLQQHLSELEPCIRRRLHGKLRGVRPGPYDHDDVLSSARRRLDEALLQGRLAVDSRSSLEALFWRTAYHIAVDLIRREVRRRDVECGSGVFQWQSSDDQPSMARLHEVLEGLPVDHRTAVELWARGLPHASIAASLGVPLSTYRSRWRRLWHRLTAQVPGEHSGVTRPGEERRRRKSKRPT